MKDKTTTHQPTPAQEGGLPGVIATAIPIALVLVWLVWLVKPWRRSKLPRARVIEQNRDSEEP
ncbi:MAG TPA: hypothetical protein VFS15_29590 [Kofleriaceae bacterium]|nr:hypothetical protein [Kofleriaceae bacterium]